MAWVAVDGNGSEYIYLAKPYRDRNCQFYCMGYEMPLPSGSIEKLIGCKLTWSDEPVELKEEFTVNLDGKRFSMAFMRECMRNYREYCEVNGYVTTKEYLSNYLKE